MEGLRGRWEEERGTWERGSGDGRKDDKAARGLHVQRWQRRVWGQLSSSVMSQQRIWRITPENSKFRPGLPECHKGTYMPK